MRNSPATSKVLSPLDHLVRRGRRCHLKLSDLRDHHLRAGHAAMRINRPEAVEDRSELMRRLLTARSHFD